MTNWDDKLNAEYEAREPKPEKREPDSWDAEDEDAIDEVDRAGD